MKNPGRKTFSWTLILVLVVGMVLGGSIVAVLASQQRSVAAEPTVASNPAPTVGPPVGPTVGPAVEPAVEPTAAQPAVDVTRMRPYTDTSPWNTPIGPSPKYDSHSDKLVATLKLDGDGWIAADTGR